MVRTAAGGPARIGRAGSAAQSGGRVGGGKAVPPRSARSAADPMVVRASSRNSRPAPAAPGGHRRPDALGHHAPPPPARRRPALFAYAQFRNDQPGPTPGIRGGAFGRKAGFPPDPRQPHHEGGAPRQSAHPVDPSHRALRTRRGTRPAGRQLLGHETRGAVACAELRAMVRERGRDARLSPHGGPSQADRLVAASLQHPSMDPQDPPAHARPARAASSVSRCAPDLHPSRSAGDRR